MAMEEGLIHPRSQKARKSGDSDFEEDAAKSSEAVHFRGRAPCLIHLRALNGIRLCVHPPPHTTHKNDKKTGTSKDAVYH